MAGDSNPVQFDGRLFYALYVFGNGGDLYPLRKFTVYVVADLQAWDETGFNVQSFH